MNKFIHSLKIPFSDFRKFWIGFLLYLVPYISIVTSIFVWGYQVECANTAIKNKKKLPEWIKWLELLKKGLLFFAISIIYFIPVIIFLLVIMFKLVSLLTPTTTPEELFTLVVQNYANELIVLVILTIFISYLVPMALVFYANKYSFKDAFDFKKLFSKTFTINYLGSWLFSSALWLISFIIISFIPSLFTSMGISESIIGIIMLIINAFILMYLSVFKYTLFGRVFSELK